MREDEIAVPVTDNSLRSYVDLVSRRRALIVAVLAGSLVLALLYLLMTPKVYGSTSRMLVEGNGDTITRRDGADPFSEAYQAPINQDVPTQIEVLQSPVLLKSASDLAGVPIDKVTVDPERLYDTNVIRIDVRSQNPEYAQKLATVFPTVYLDYVNGSRTGDLKRSLDFARQKLAEEQKLLARAELAMEDLQRRTGISNLTKERELAITGSATVSLDALRADIELQGLQGELEAATRERNSMPTFVETPVTTTNTNIAMLESKVADLQTEREKQIVLYKPNHPKIQEIDSQIAALRGRINSSPRTVTTTTRTVNPALQAANQKIADLRASVKAKQAQVGRARSASASTSNQVSKFSSFERLAAQLQRDIDRHRDNVVVFTKGVEGLTIREKASRVPVKLLSSAGPAKLIKPKPTNILAAALLIGLFLGLVAAVAKDYFDPKIYSWQTARRILEAPVLGFIPSISAGNRMLSSTRDQTALQSYRVLRTNVQFSALSAGTRSLLFTATLPSEGKSTTAINYATSLAMDGKSVLLIDVDLMNPNVSRHLKVERDPGLVDVLMNEISLSNAIRSTDTKGLSILTAGKSTTNGTELLNSALMVDLLRQAKEYAEVIVLDGPSLLSGADGQIVSSLVDGVIYVVQPGKVKEPSLYYAVHLLRQAKANLVGVVFNRVDSKSMENAFYYGSRSSAYGQFQGLPTWQTPELPGRGVGEPGDVRETGPSTAVPQ